MPVALPSPGIVFGADFLARLGTLLARMASQRERREGGGRARLFGAGSEFVGYRPYRSGEDLRALDWNLLARLGRPYVRVTACEASERWTVLLDTSASMGVGRPGKLQLAAELAVALAALGVRQGATVWLHTRAAEPLASARKPAAVQGWMRALEQVRAEGEAGLGALVRRLAPARGAGRWFLIGDFLDCEPGEVLALTRPARELFLTQILAREELSPSASGPVRWIDAESGAALVRAVDPSSTSHYERLLTERLERWRSGATRARALHGCWTSTTPFETLARALCARMG